MTTMTYTGELSIETCWCGIVHAVPTALVDEQLRLHRDGRKQMSIYCPLGHEWARTGKGRAAELEEELERAKARLLSTRDQLQSTERSLTAQRAQTTRARNELARQAKRSAAGVCPCCQRSFVQLARHMKTKHPDHATQEAPDAP